MHPAPHRHGSPPPAMAPGSKLPTAQTSAIINKIMVELDKLAHAEKKDKRIKRAEKLTLYVKNALRERGEDHLLQTTAIWALINIFRVDADSARRMMLDAGIPSILYDILSSQTLTAASRQYASELCFFLCSADYHITAQSLLGGSGQKLPDIHPPHQQPPPLRTGSRAGSRVKSRDGPLFQQQQHQQQQHQQEQAQGPALDDYLLRRETAMAAAADASSSASATASAAGLHSEYADFAPYTVSDENLHAMDGLFRPGSRGSGAGSRASSSRAPSRGGIAGGIGGGGIARGFGGGVGGGSRAASRDAALMSQSLDGPMPARSQVSSRGRLRAVGTAHALTHTHTPRPITQHHPWHSSHHHILPCLSDPF